MFLVTPTQMRELDRRTIHDFKVPGLLLMERAGWGAVQSLFRELGPTRRLRVDVFCGPGNNGGDGYVIARYLRTAGHRVRCFAVGDFSKATDDTRINRRRAERLKITVEEVTDLEDLPTDADHSADVVVDALLGTGFAGAPREPFASAIRLINAYEAFCLAVDIPSGVNGADGAVHEDLAIQADLTVTFGLPKVGQLAWPGHGYVGHLSVIDIGLAPEAIAELALPAHAACLEGIRDFLPERDPRGHKATFGRLAIIAGSKGLSGAAILTARAALRVGTGLVALGAPHAQIPALTLGVLEAVKRGLPEVRKAECLSTRSLGDIVQLLKEFPTAAIGPGLGRHHETQELVLRLLPRLPGPAVLDADGIFALGGHAEMLADLPHPLILTPHPGEFARVFGGTVAEITADPIAHALKAAETSKRIVLLKGAPSVIALPDGRYWVNPYGNDGMATGGSGDVLTGCIAGFLAQGLAPEAAAVLGMAVHSLAGDRAAARLGRHGMIAGDIVRALPRTMREVDEFTPFPALPQNFVLELPLG